MDYFYKKNIFKKSIFFLSVLLVIYILSAAFNNADWDLWARLAVGKIFFATGSVLKHDIFAYTSVKAFWIDHEWLTGVCIYFFADKFGDLGLQFLRYILLFAVFMSIFKLNQLKFPEQNHYRIIYYSFFIYALFFGFENVVRAQCFTYAFFALWMYVLELVKRGNSKLIWIFPVTTVIWANLHGGFVAGLGLVFIYALGEAINRRNFAKYLLILALSCFAILINPYGFKYIPYLINAVLMPRPFITEWQPLNLFGAFNFAFGFKIFALFTVFLLPYLFIKKFKEINWAEIIIVVVVFGLSLEHIRHNMFFIILFAGYFTGYFYQASEFYTKNIISKLNSEFVLKFINIFKLTSDFAIYGFIILFGILTIHFVHLKVNVNEKRFPVNAVKFIEQNHLSGNLLVLFNWGSYALWKLYPQCLVAVDGRYDGVYSDSLINESARFQYVVTGWKTLLNKYHTDIMLIDTNNEVFKILNQLEDWRIVYQDKTSAVFIPVSKNKKHWIIPDEKFNINNEKYKTRILN